MKRHLQAGTVPLAVLTAYYRRDLRIPSGSARPRSAVVPRRRRSVRIVVTDAPDDELRSGVIDVTVVEFAAHAAYLEPVTGMGFLVPPPSGTDISAVDAWNAGDVALWSEHEPSVGLSLQAADRTNALELLADAGWTLLETGDGTAEIAGHTDEGSPALCLYAERTTRDQLVVEDFHRAFTALHAAAELR
ncbi:hypothetical protein E1218_32125 [Kribbella turkmenica]|uniref:Uncharacterized protein n=1 Tax=Kribbella turkmenica TaxID=2530375 RepID=A0A4R4WFT1_9ACTN|nr:hypothetical protein [Kribbella turkmenica]TDD15074.1 hypothetical protein E1218_32125 [Kribbella turkmenica]